MTVEFGEGSEWATRALKLRSTFTPAAPVTNQDLFAGRVHQLVRLWDTIHAPGEHGAVFGERGVGKTSLARNAEYMALMSGSIALRINCQANDTPADIWRRVESALAKRATLDEAQSGPTSDHVEVMRKAVGILGVVSASTHEVLAALELLASRAPVIIFLDEYDRIGDSSVEAELVDVMKTLADQGIDVTIVVVGVAADVDALITEHESIGRGFNEIEMPRMSIDELEDVVKNGLARAGMTVATDAVRFIAQLSTGLPHYAHLMGLHAGLEAVERAELEVGIDATIQALNVAVERAQQHVSRLYYDATHSTRQNMYAEVLLAAALTPVDERGYFAPGDMREPLRRITSRHFEIPAFAGHLSQFASDRGPVLERSGKTRRPRYRFTEPLLVPYVSMRGVRDAVIDVEIARGLLAARHRD